MKTKPKKNRKEYFRALASLDVRNGRRNPVGTPRDRRHLAAPWNFRYLIDVRT